jgi:hypothetical protein
MESQQWLLHVHFDRASMKDVCFAAMDSANMRLQHAFDRTYNRLFKATRHAAHVVDGLLALVTGDAVACDAFDASPYVLSIIPEQVDYFASCVHTDVKAVAHFESQHAFAISLKLAHIQSDAALNMGGRRRHFYGVEDHKGGPVPALLHIV